MPHTEETGIRIAGPTEAAVTLRAAGESDPEFFDCLVEVTCPGFQMSGPMRPSTFHLVTFVEQLERMHRSLEGQAVLAEYEESIIRLRVVDRARGMIAVDGKLVPLPNSLLATFAGATTNQSYLPEILRDLRKLLGGERPR